MSNNTVIVKLLDKEYQVACPPGQQEALRDSARYLDQQMRAIRAHGKVIGLERIAVMAALNITNELLSKDEQAAAETGNNQLKQITDKLDTALQRFSQLEI